MLNPADDHAIGVYVGQRSEDGTLMVFSMSGSFFFGAPSRVGVKPEKEEQTTDSNIRASEHRVPASDEIR